MPQRSVVDVVSEGFMFRLSASYDGKLWHCPLPRAAATLGSSEENELVLPVPGVSRQHVRVERLDGGGVVLVDLGSRSGIRLRTTVSLRAALSVRSGARGRAFLLDRQTVH